MKSIWNESTSEQTLAYDKQLFTWCVTLGESYKMVGHFLFGYRSKFIFHVFSFPGATDETLLSKLHAQHKDNEFYEVPQMKENAFTIVHYAGKVKYKIQVSSTLWSVL